MKKQCVHFNNILNFWFIIITSSSLKFWLKNFISLWSWGLIFIENKLFNQNIFSIKQTDIEKHHFPLQLAFYLSNIAPKSFILHHIQLTSKGAWSLMATWVSILLTRSGSGEGFNMTFSANSLSDNSVPNAPYASTMFSTAFLCESVLIKKKAILNKEKCTHVLFYTQHGRVEGTLTNDTHLGCRITK